MALDKSEYVAISQMIYLSIKNIKIIDQYWEENKELSLDFQNLESFINKQNKNLVESDFIFNASNIFKFRTIASQEFDPYLIKSKEFEFTLHERLKYDNI